MNHQANSNHFQSYAAERQFDCGILCRTWGIQVGSWIVFGSCCYCRLELEHSNFQMYNWPQFFIDAVIANKRIQILVMGCGGTRSLLGIIKISLTEDGEGQFCFQNMTKLLPYSQIWPVLLQADNGSHMLPPVHHQVQRHRLPAVQVPEEGVEEVQELFAAWQKATWGWKSVGWRCQRENNGGGGGRRDGRRS